MSVELPFAFNEGFATMLAPMAGYTDFAFRAICHDYGVDLTVTEMVSAKALVMGNELSRRMLFRKQSDKPSFCQIFGHEADVMADSVRLPEVKSFDGVDINMGCPVRKIVGNGDGSALLENPRLASKCISAVKQALGNKPLSVKFRLGVSDSSGAVDFAKMCADSGADFVTIHFRTRKQMYSGNADYSLLPQLAKVGIPIVANGDVATREQCLSLAVMGASGVALGRGALGRPYIFAEIRARHFRFDVLETINRHAKLLLEVFDERVVANEMKKHVASYLKGMRNGKSVTVAVMNAHTLDEILTPCRIFFENNPELRSLIQ